MRKKARSSTKRTSRTSTVSKGELRSQQAHRQAAAQAAHPRTTTIAVAVAVVAVVRAVVVRAKLSRTNKDARGPIQIGPLGVYRCFVTKKRRTGSLIA
jgi:hypothetical protein